MKPAADPAYCCLRAGMMASATLSAMDAGASGIIPQTIAGQVSFSKRYAGLPREKLGGDPAVLRSALSSSCERMTPAKNREITERQRFVLRCILDGLSNKEIRRSGSSFSLSETSVKASIRELFDESRRSYQEPARAGCNRERVFGRMVKRRTKQRTDRKIASRFGHS